MAKAGFAVRIIRPFNDAQGAVTGYVEFGEELGQFIHDMENQTGDDYDNPSYVVADNTSDSENILRFDGDLASIPAGGMVL